METGVRIGALRPLPLRRSSAEAEPSFIQQKDPDIWVRVMERGVGNDSQITNTSSWVDGGACRLLKCRRPKERCFWEEGSVERESSPAVLLRSRRAGRGQVGSCWHGESLQSEERRGPGRVTRSAKL